LLLSLVHRVKGPATWTRSKRNEQFLPPVGGFLLFAECIVESHQALDRFGEADLALRRYGRRPLLHPLIAGQQQRFGVGVFLLAQQCPAEQRLRVERGPDIGLRLLADGQALAEERLVLGPFSLCLEFHADLREQAGQLRADTKLSIERARKPKEAGKAPQCCFCPS